MRDLRKAAEKIAEGLESYGEGCTCYAAAYRECACDAVWPEMFIKDAAFELRRLHEVNVDLLDALQRARPHIGVGYSGIQRQEILRVVDEAIAKAKGDTSE